MPRLTIETDSVANADFLASFLRTVRSVKKVFIEPDVTDSRGAHVVREPSEEYNWTNPSRPATDEEIEKMLDECEASPLMTAEEAEAKTLEEIKAWKKRK